MRNTFLSLACLIFLFGCSTNNGITTVVPSAPTNLTATVASTTQVNLSWTENSTNESGYKIQRKTGGGNFSDIGSTGADIATFTDMGLTPNTTYTYRVYAYNGAGNSLQYSNEVIVTTNLVPIITTSPISDTTAVSASCGGNIASDNGSPVTSRGVCWSTASGPTVTLPTKTTNGTGTGSFNSNITGLNTNTTYYVRAYATNANGSAYGNELTFTTKSFINLPSVTIGTQIWSLKNLDIASYRNGDPIPQVTDPTQWANLTTGAWCWYNNDSASYAATYGRLYNWYAVNDSRGLAPQGWHVPTDVEWNKLVRFLDPSADTICQNCPQSNTAGGKLKSTSLWQSPNTGATNSSGFSGIPNGGRYDVGSFGLLGELAGWWSSTTVSSSNAWARFLSYQNSNFGKGEGSKKGGLSLRILRD